MNATLSRNVKKSKASASPSPSKTQPVSPASPSRVKVRRDRVFHRWITFSELKGPAVMSMDFAILRNVKLEAREVREDLAPSDGCGPAYVGWAEGELMGPNALVNLTNARSLRYRGSHFYDHVSDSVVRECSMLMLCNDGSFFYVR